MKEGICSIYFNMEPTARNCKSIRKRQHKINKQKTSYFVFFNILPVFLLLLTYNYQVLFVFFKLIFSSIVILENTFLAKHQTFQIKLKSLLTPNPSLLPDTWRKQLDYLICLFSLDFFFNAVYFVGFIFLFILIFFKPMQGLNLQP